MTVSVCVLRSAGRLVAGSLNSPAVLEKEQHKRQQEEKHCRVEYMMG
jgi:hypothetical protein